MVHVKPAARLLQIPRLIAREEIRVSETRDLVGFRIYELCMWGIPRNCVLRFEAEDFEVACGCLWHPG